MRDALTSPPPMGQQQLLLLVLGIVGLAVVVGIQAFGENQKKSQLDNYTSVGMAGEIIAWYQKPTAQGGGGNVAATLGPLTLQKLGYTQTGADVWGPYTRTGFVSNGMQRWLAVQGSTTTHPFLHIVPDPLVTGSMRVEVHCLRALPGVHRQPEQLLWGLADVVGRQGRGGRAGQPEPGEVRVVACNIPARSTKPGHPALTRCDLLPASVCGRRTRT